MLRRWSPKDSVTRLLAEAVTMKLIELEVESVCPTNKLKRYQALFESRRLDFPSHKADTVAEAEKKT